MKRTILALACVLFSICSISAAEHLLWNFGWRFALGEHDGAEAVAYDDSSWRELDLPYDYQLGLPWDCDRPSHARPWLISSMRDGIICSLPARRVIRLTPRRCMSSTIRTAAAKEKTYRNHHPNPQDYTPVMPVDRSHEMRNCNDAVYNAEYLFLPVDMSDLTLPKIRKH